MIAYHLLKESSSPLGRAESLTRLYRTLLFLLRSGSSALSFKLRFYHMLLSYIRIVAIKIIVRNEVAESFKPHSQTLQRLGDLLVHFDLASRVEDKIALTLGLKELRNIYTALRQGQDNIKISSYWKKQIHYYHQVLELIDIYRQRVSKTQCLKQKTKWKSFLQNGVLDYEVRLAETLFELGKLELGSKIPSPFSESYYSESGRNAFRNFTRDKFISTLQCVQQRAETPKVLDIGCGYGNYIEATLHWNHKAEIDGYEIQSELYSEVSARFKEHGQVQVYHENILLAQPKKEYDIILLNYVLFYFTREQKRQLFLQLKRCLAPNGSILICQYYAGIESMKSELASKQNDYSLARKIEMHYGNKVLYANALWNESANTFSEAEDWQEFNKTLKDAGLSISGLTNADRFYYSLFIDVRQA